MRHAFTLIELLVVITIIVVLLSLLTPALDKAIYQAELATCGASVRGIGSGFTTYAMDHRRRYPERPGFETDGSWDLSIVTAGGGPATYGFDGLPKDFRPLLRPYMSLNKQLIDPMVEGIDIEASRVESYTYSSYHLFGGWRYSDAAYGGGSMSRLGDRLAWNGHRFSTLAADADHFNLPGYAMASHPDRDGLLVNRTWQDQDLVTGGELGPTGVAAGTLSTSWWDQPVEGSPARGLIDRNVGFTDGSVERFNEVPLPRGDGFIEDERFASVPWTKSSEHVNGTWPTYGVQIPRR